MVDGQTLCSGSYNWTRQGEDGNYENVVIYRNHIDWRRVLVVNSRDCGRNSRNEVAVVISLFILGLDLFFLIFLPIAMRLGIHATLAWI